MKFKIAAAAFTAALLASTSAQAVVAAGCAVPSTAAPLRTLYADPVKGNDANPGTQAAPWKTIQGALVKPGDLVLLMGGSFGDVHIDGIKLSDFATIKAFPGAVPVFATATMRGSSHWLVQGVKFQSLSTPDTIYTALMDISGGFFGISDNIIIDQNSFSSIDSSTKWVQADWVAKARWEAISVDGGDANSTNVHCVTITNNTIKNIRWGISAGANDMLLDSNTIDNYGDDGIDFAGNRIMIHANRLTNNRDIGDGNHNDGMQGQIGRGVQGTVYDSVTIDGNAVLGQTVAGLPFPGDLQGISAFDMDWSNLKAVNNDIVVNAYHGLAFYSCHGCLLANNVVLGPIAWLGVFSQSHQGTPSNDVVVRNNVVSTISSDTGGATFDHNLSAGQIAWMLNGQQFFYNAPGVYGNQNVIDPNATNVFVKYLPATFGYDFHLKPAPNAARNSGGTPAPNKADGSPRTVDLGRY